MHSHLPRRAAGILLHPTALPGPHGIGTLGVAALRFVDFLVEAQQSLWQVLPLGPTGFGDSPYSTFCSVAGNPLLIDLVQLQREGVLNTESLARSPELPAARVDFGALIAWKMPLLEHAAQQFLARAPAEQRAAYETFCSEQAEWLDHYALFRAVKDHFDRAAAEAGRGGAPWNRLWDADIARCEPVAVARWRARCRPLAELHKIWQFWFFRQWQAVKRYANERGIRIIGDMPIFVALDSADVWHSPNRFQLDEARQELVVSGVPPDYFSATGQRWGNPMYDWSAMEANGFAWWILRFRKLFQQVDIVRIDHFRGFESCWEVPAHEPTAEHGHWRQVPGEALFTRLLDALGPMPILAEDLGHITPEVESLRDRFGFPGMRVLQIGLENVTPENIHLSHHHIPNTVVYTGSHDNDTTKGWYDGLSADQQSAVRDYLNVPDGEMVWHIIRAALASVSRAAIVPMQDALGLGSEARFNRPGTSGNNWTWRLPPGYASPELAARWAHLTTLYGRAPSGDGGP